MTNVNERYNERWMYYTTIYLEQNKNQVIKTKIKTKN